MINDSGASSGALPKNQLNYRSNEAIKLDATSVLLIEAKGCTDQDNSDLEVICNQTTPNKETVTCLALRRQMAKKTSSTRKYMATVMGSNIYTFIEV